MSKRKNNRADAGKLARLLYLDAVTSVWVPGKDTRLWRQTIEFRQSLLIRLVALKNQVRASLRERGIAAPQGHCGQRLGDGTLNSRRSSI